MGVDLDGEVCLEAKKNNGETENHRVTSDFGRPK